MWPEYAIALLGVVLAQGLLVVGLEARNLIYARTILKQQAILLNRRPRIAPDVRRRVCRLLIDSRLFDTPERRRLLLRDLPTNLVRAIAVHNSETVDLNEIVQAAARWSLSAWQGLLNNALDELGGSEVGDELAHLCAEWL